MSERPDHDFMHKWHVALNRCNVSRRRNRPEGRINGLIPNGGGVMMECPGCGGYNVKTTVEEEDELIPFYSYMCRDCGESWDDDDPEEYDVSGALSYDDFE
jgi:hypothetical protein